MKLVPVDQDNIKKIDNHHAAMSGKVSEQYFRESIRNAGFSILRSKDEFIEAYGKRGLNYLRDSIHLNVPKWWEEEANFFSKKGKKAKFYVDGYLPEFDLRVELKYTNAYGTTEEKVMFDLEKIRDGAYSEKKLLYVIFGPLAKKQNVFNLFELKVKSLDPKHEKVKVILDDSPDLILVKNYLQSLKEEKEILCKHLA